ncbi:G-type lectin S-receptor-like serine/threonine-protein kinase SD1-13 [Papaver somniferum]|uniref:G-type lectin S-receptor-like serine/threonine-protein kinase SD1-13 n=1 Tax=Papaver somniferum TaxID=3469 RepID=UPI000E6FF432|nr:G-type lectin S-receptor-like serine/threonine-protein kinase SD1-13 [Papaver somniferum]
MTDPKTLVSSTDGIFSLGFFSPGDSRNRCLGIWYTNIPEKTIVWVANRDDPVTDSSGVLRIADDGNLLVIKNGSERKWRSGPWMQLKEETRGEFAKDYPFRTSLNLFRDPTKGTVYLTISNENNASALRLILDANGQLREKQWDETKKEWRNNWSSPVTEYCEDYNKCGPFGACNPDSSPICRCWTGFKPKFINEWNHGNWSGGCAPSKELQCEKTSNETTRKGTDVFEESHVEKLPDYSISLEGVNTDMQCKEYCLNNCLPV